MEQSLGAKTLAIPSPAWLIGTYDRAGKPNIMTIAWSGMCGARPPAVAVSLRKATHSQAAIVACKAFTVNIPRAAQVAQIDLVGIVSGRTVDKFALCGWTPTRSTMVDRRTWRRHR